VVAAGLAGWHLLKRNRPQEARARFEPLLRGSGTPIDRAATEIARAWLTRLDAPRVRVALKDYYIEHVGYPAKLDELKTLPGGDLLPLTDRWNRPWEYRLVGYRMLHKMRNQKYELGCRTLVATLDLDRALAVPYASRIDLQPVGLERTRTPPMVRFTRAASENGGDAAPVFLPLGHRHEGMTFAWMGARLIILSDLDHWKILGKPR
jgi:hypothetical protein